MVERLGRIGYQAFTLSKEGLHPCPGIDEQTQETNFVFVHEQQHRQIADLLRSMP
ncbi:hypothetical protein D3C80_1861670 [compost metagenome]